MPVTATAVTDVVIGDLYRILGDGGNALPGALYRAKQIRPDGNVTLWGGDIDPNGRRMWRTVTPDRIRPLTAAERRKYVHTPTEEHHATRTTKPSRRHGQSR